MGFTLEQNSQLSFYIVSLAVELQSIRSTSASPNESQRFDPISFLEPKNIFDKVSVFLLRNTVRFDQ